MNFILDYDDFNMENPFDNKYYKIKLYKSYDPDLQTAEEITDGSSKLVRCPTSELYKYPSGRWFARKSVCLENSLNTTLKSNWWTGLPYYSLVIAIEKCKNTA